jgi:hypothetical protein
LVAVRGLPELDLLRLLQLAAVLLGCSALLAPAHAALLARPRLDLSLWHLTQHWPQLIL